MTTRPKWFYVGAFGTPSLFGRAAGLGRIVRNSDLLETGKGGRNRKRGQVQLIKFERKLDLSLLTALVKDWVENRSPEEFFKKTQDQAVFDSFQAMVNWVYAQPQFFQAAKTEFASVADGWLLAYAHANGLTVVTHEEFAPKAKRSVPMPNVCLEFDIDYVLSLIHI